MWLPLMWIGIDKFPTLTTKLRAGRGSERIERDFEIDRWVAGNMENEIAEIRDSVAILRVGLQSDLETSLDFMGGAGGPLDNIHEALQVCGFLNLLVH